MKKRARPILNLNIFERRQPFSEWNWLFSNILLNKIYSGVYTKYDYRLLHHLPIHNYTNRKSLHCKMQYPMNFLRNGVIQLRNKDESSIKVVLCINLDMLLQLKENFQITRTVNKNKNLLNVVNDLPAKKEPARL